MSSYDLNAFNSPNFPPLVNGQPELCSHSVPVAYCLTVGIDIVVNWNDVLRQTSLRRFRAHKGDYCRCPVSSLPVLDFTHSTGMCPHVATLRLFPGISGATVKAFFLPTIRGVILETFGAGNAPQRADLMQALKEACDRGVVVVAITQCAKGSVSDAYETGRTMLQFGVVSGGDMTPEVSPFMI